MSVDPLGSDSVGTAIVTDLSGNLVEVLHDGFGLFGPDDEPHRLGELVDSTTHDKLDDFLGAAAASAAFDWEFRSEAHGDGAPLRMSAVRLDARLLVLLTTDRDGTGRLTGELLRINNEQVNTYRSHMKHLGANPAATAVQLDEFTRVNNELANLQRELSRTNAQLERSNALKDQFLGMAAHELRTPLSVMSMYAQFLDEEVEFDDEQRRMITTIRRAVLGMRELVDDLLDVAAIQTGRLDLQPTSVDLRQVAQDVVDRLAPLAERKQVLLTANLPSTGTLAEADPSKLAQVLDNLVTNAIKFSHPGATVTVSVVDDERSRSLIVSDEGVGIPDEAVAELFAPFRSSRVGTGGERGSGLGLTIAKRIVDAHGGSIEVDSGDGRGTVVTVRIPR